ncbi:MAG TPA: normocyte-binding protein [Firmicutes bacterium]|jgi:hypothetical protein|nr:normocyte-binding protein [Bacillota bacterium]HOQ24762.1 normocyte-binding protein [Bacillota bacterium]HPT67895.1 normocyte-binding protein [Bacillota bacterium]
MKELMLEKLKSLEDLEQRKLLKDILTGVFANLVDYQEKFNEELEFRVFCEIDDIESNYDIYFALCPKYHVDPVDDFLFPVFPEDMEEKKFDLKALIEQLNKEGEVQLFPVFLACSYPELQRLAGAKSYSGLIITDNNKYAIKVRLEPSAKYRGEIERLYRIFQKNGVAWKTVNAPYNNKFFDVVLTECVSVIDPREEIREIELDLGELDAYKKTDMVLLWNIERLAIKSGGFPVSAIDRINYEHIISIKKMGLNHGYLVDEQDDPIRYIKRTRDEITIVSPMEKSEAWHLLKVSQPGEEAEKTVKCELVSNCRKRSFINRYAQRQAALIRTKGDIIRIINSFAISQYFKLIEIEIADRSTGDAVTYDLNYFLADDIRISNDKKVMKLKFATDGRAGFITHDLLSFLVSEVQMYFPEYTCEGVLV